MQQYTFILLLASSAVVYYCINYSSFLRSTSSASSRRNKQLRPLIHDYKVTSQSSSSTTNKTIPISTNRNVEYVESIQGSISHPIIQRNAGLLPHKHVTTKALGSVDNCNMTSNRIKHIIKSSASSLYWKEDYSSWEVWNDRGNSNPDVDTGTFQYVIIKDKFRTNETITFVDQTVAMENDASAKKGEWLAQDPRVILYNGKRIIIYHSRVQRQMWLYDHDTKQSVMLTLCGHGTDGIQKNWSPVIISDKILLLVYTIDPLVILRYDVDNGDGVCTVVYGHLPLRSGMNEPYGGTPFVEIKNPDTIADTDRVMARSFLSFGHSRKANDFISKDRVNNHRVYRPVPLVLHLFCVKSNIPNDVTGDFSQGVTTLEDCTFAMDIYDMWHEVESPTFLLTTNWKRIERKARSVSFPYDLHVFPKNQIVRVGLEYEDCYSVYEDYEIELDAMLELQLTHPIRIALEEHYNENIGGVLPTLVESTSLDCPSIYSHAGEQKLYATPLVAEDDLAQRIDGKIWVVSHQYRYSRTWKELNNIMLPIRIGRKEQHPKNIQLDTILDHYPYPLQKTKAGNTTLAPKLCIYVYGSIYSSIISEINNNGNLDTTKIIHNDNTYPRFLSLDQLLHHPDDDPTGIRHQFENYLTANNLVYPIILLRDDALEHPQSIKRLNQFVSHFGYDDDITDLLDKKGFRKLNSPSLDSIEDDDLRERFEKRFLSLNATFESQPIVNILLPKNVPIDME